MTRARRSGTATRPVPRPGEAPLPAPDAAALLRRHAADPVIGPAPAVRFGEGVWTHAELHAEACRWARLFLARRSVDRPLHVGVLLDNTPDYLFALSGAALSGSVVVGVNHTRRGEHLLRDLVHTDIDLVVTEPRHLPLLAPLADRLPGGRPLVSHRYPEAADPGADGGDDLDDLDGALDASTGRGDPGIEPGPDATWCLIFTSGTSGAPKAVIGSQRRLLVTGTRMGIIMDVGPRDVGYVCMPLFHSNALMVGWAPALVAGAAVGLARRFSASGWLADVRRYQATYFGYTGKPLAYLLATPERPDDADNSLRVAFGNEGNATIVDGFARRYGVEVIDAYGATEGGVAVNREVAARTGALGQAGPEVQVVDDDGHPLPPARFDAAGRLANADECVGEIVNTGGVGPFEGYYNNPEANARTTRFGWYWTGDLGYLDADRYLYFAGRTADWVRVDGENFLAAPIEAAIARHPNVVLAAVYGVPDAAAGDQVMAAVVLRDAASFDPTAFAAWVDAQDDLGPKWRPRYVRLLADPPTTGTNKVVTRTLVHEKWRADRTRGDPVFVRERGDPAYRRFDGRDEEALQAAFARNDRERFWDL